MKSCWSYILKSINCIGCLVPPSETAILEEIMAKVPDHPHSGEDQTHEAAAQPHPEGSHSSRSRTPHRRNNDPVGWTLAMV